MKDYFFSNFFFNFFNSDSSGVLNYHRLGTHFNDKLECCDNIKWGHCKQDKYYTNIFLITKC